MAQLPPWGRVVLRKNNVSLACRAQEDHVRAGICFRVIDRLLVLVSLSTLLKSTEFCGLV